jgi:UMF1 family MFS transporter
MTTAEANGSFRNVDEATYQRRIRAWTLYDWGNSAFATTILAAVLPAYYSNVAGATLPSEATATAYWSVGLSISLFLVAIISPILGTVSDIQRNKKPLLSVFTGVGVVATGCWCWSAPATGCWPRSCSCWAGSGSRPRMCSMTPCCPRGPEEDQDMVSSRGYAMGYLGGGLLLAINVLMIQFIPDSLFDYAGIRLSFLSVAIWWAVFTIPLLRTVPEPPAAAEKLQPGQNVVSVSFGRLARTLKDISQYRELFKFLVAFFIYNDGIGTIIGVAVIYGAELGFGTLELVRALRLVQFVGIPFSLIFGRLPSAQYKNRPFYLAFILFNLVALPVMGLLLSRALPVELSGAAPAPFVTTDEALGEGRYTLEDSGDPRIAFAGEWARAVVSAADSGLEADSLYAVAAAPGASTTLTFTGQKVELTYSSGPDRGIWAVLLDGEPLLDGEEPVRIDAYSPTVRYGAVTDLLAPTAGLHTLSIVNTGEQNPDSAGTVLSLTTLEVRPPLRQSNLLLVLGPDHRHPGRGAALRPALWDALLQRDGGRPDDQAQRAAGPGHLLRDRDLGLLHQLHGRVLVLAWMVAIVQGGSQALSRSLYAGMSPAAKSGEFFGLFGIMEKFSSILGPLLFAAAVAVFGSSRPAVVSLIVLFILGGWLLTRVNVEEGRRVAQAENAAALGK